MFSARLTKLWIDAFKWITYKFKMAKILWYKLYILPGFTQPFL